MAFDVLDKQETKVWHLFPQQRHLISGGVYVSVWEGEVGGVGGDLRYKLLIFRIKKHSPLIFTLNLEN